MSLSAFHKYASFFSQEELEQLTGLLEQEKIPFKTQKSEIHFDPSLANTELNREFELLLNPTDFERVNQLRKQEAVELINELPDDYYLFEFSDQELIDLLRRPDEWNPRDQVLARHLLSERGLELDEEHIKLLEKQRIHELSREEKSETFWIILGYISAIAGGLFGLIIGWHFWKQQKTLPDGSRQFIYREQDRKHGLRIWWLSLFAIVTALVLRFMFMDWFWLGGAK
ncbi:MAG: hypothetical protein EP338_04910 [Bacteroidetes bacterium]|nr:MAG: hypothetical protein EP338_04910 [Bacteroidota bacterium]